jgi:hypothetical protein
MTAMTWRAHLDQAVAALQAIQRADGPETGDVSGPAADPLMAALCALETSRTARAHLNELITGLTEQAAGLGANWAALGHRFDAYNE